jgi:hypothetical protein
VSEGYERGYEEGVMLYAGQVATTGKKGLFFPRPKKSDEKQQKNVTNASQYRNNTQTESICTLYNLFMLYLLGLVFHSKGAKKL